MADSTLPPASVSGKSLTADRLKQLYRYDPETGIFTRKSSGNPVGSANARGYVTLCIDRAHYYVHRLAWLYMTGDWPHAQIDHRNRNKTDNRFANLRDATNAENQWNIGLQKNNRSGFRGVSFSTRYSRWRASITLKGKHRTLGYFQNVEDAAKAYQAATVLREP